jgi:general secretion pathway protein J
MAARRNAGFTLIEVMVALLIMAAIAVMAWRGIDGMLRSREISQAHLLRTERLQTVLVQWEQDLRSLQEGSISISPLSFDGAALRIVRQQREGLQLVAWTLSEGRLYRWESAAATTLAELNQAYARAQQSLGQEGNRVVTLDGLEGWQLYFYRGNGWSNAQSSDDLTTTSTSSTSSTSSTTGITTTTATTSRVLPTGVRMILQFAPSSGFGGPLTRQILLTTPSTS